MTGKYFLEFRDGYSGQFRGEDIGLFIRQAKFLASLVIRLVGRQIDVLGSVDGFHCIEFVGAGIEQVERQQAYTRRRAYLPDSLERGVIRPEPDFLCRLCRVRTNIGKCLGRSKHRIRYQD